MIKSIWLPVLLALGTGFFGGVLYTQLRLPSMTDKQILADESYAWDLSALSFAGATTEIPVQQICQDLVDSTIYWADKVKRFQAPIDNGGDLHELYQTCARIQNEKS